MADFSLFDRLKFSLPDGRFRYLQRGLGGMLEWRTYRRIYRELSKRPDLDAVEIGAARGAGSVAAAWSYRDLKRKGALIVVEKLDRGSRTGDGSYEQNRHSIEQVFEHFNVADHIRLFPHHLTLKNGPEAVSLIRTGRLSSLIHDADGRLERDFSLFWPLLIDDAFIMVDDYEEIVEKKSGANGVFYLSKKLLTYRLLNKLADWGLFVFDDVENGTAFGRKPAGADFQRLDMEECRRIVEEVKVEAGGV